MGAAETASHRAPCCKSVWAGYTYPSESGSAKILSPPGWKKQIYVNAANLTVARAVKMHQKILSSYHFIWLLYEIGGNVWADDVKAVFGK